MWKSAKASPSTDSTTTAFTFTTEGNDVNDNPEKVHNQYTQGQMDWLEKNYHKLPAEDKLLICIGLFPDEMLEIK